MDIKWPEFVIGTDDATARDTAHVELTGWETVVFQLEDQEPGSDFSTAAIAP